MPMRKPMARPIPWKIRVKKVTIGSSMAPLSNAVPAGKPRGTKG
jgi:hypothetical protein